MPQALLIALALLSAPLPVREAPMPTCATLAGQWMICRNEGLEWVYEFSPDGKFWDKLPSQERFSWTGRWHLAGTVLTLREWAIDGSEEWLVSFDLATGLCWHHPWQESEAGDFPVPAPVRLFPFTMKRRQRP